MTFVQSRPDTCEWCGDRIEKTDKRTEGSKGGVWFPYHAECQPNDDDQTHDLELDAIGAVRW